MRLREVLPTVLSSIPVTLGFFKQVPPNVTLTVPRGDYRDRLPTVGFCSTSSVIQSMPSSETVPLICLLQSSLLRALLMLFWRSFMGRSCPNTQDLNIPLLFAATRRHCRAIRQRGQGDDPMITSQTFVFFQVLISSRTSCAE